MRPKHCKSDGDRTRQDLLKTKSDREINENKKQTDFEIKEEKNLENIHINNNVFFSMIW